MIYAEILAGGSGTRMGNTDKPKQFLMLGNKPIIIHTLEQFLMNPSIDEVLVIVPKIWMEFSKDIINSFIADTTKIVVIEGGSTRNETIMNGCRYIEKTHGINDDDIILTHDSVRPFVNQRIINDNIKKMEQYVAVDTIIPAADTIVESLDGEVITSIPVRNNFYQGQTPQSFKIKDLMSVYKDLTDDEKQILTDACKIFVLKGLDVGIVEGEAYNIKITTMYDLKVANAIVEEDIHD